MKSWGNIYSTYESKFIKIQDLKNLSFSNIDKPLLAYGLGRSYGDSCLISQGSYIDLTKCKKVIDFDSSKGIIECESGISLEELANIIMPEWFIPVSPGTKFVTLGGAIANDVHGKNHHKCGTFGAHVISLELLRSNGEKLTCSMNENVNMFKATIGGLGLTGLVTKAKIKLIKAGSFYIQQKKIKFQSLDEYFSISNTLDKVNDYSVAWVDCINGKNIKGIYMTGNFLIDNQKNKKINLKISVPFYFPYKLLNRYTIKIFNFFYYHLSRQGLSNVYYDKFFYPLDSIHNWNRIYSKKGFYQLQFVINQSNKNDLNNIFAEIKKSGMGSFLAVLKTFGDLSSPGMLSFPKKGYTLALDFPNHGEKTVSFIKKIEEMVISIGGRIYPAKDILMSKENFHKSYDLSQFSHFRDKSFNSDFSKRMKI